MLKCWRAYLDWDNESIFCRQSGLFHYLSRTKSDHWHPVRWQALFCFAASRSDEMLAMSIFDYYRFLSLPWFRSIFLSVDEPGSLHKHNYPPGHCFVWRSLFFEQKVRYRSSEIWKVTRQGFELMVSWFNLIKLSFQQKTPDLTYY